MSNKRSISSEKHAEESKRSNGTRLAVSFAVVAMLAFTAFALAESSGNAAADPWDGEAAERFSGEQAFATAEDGDGEPGSETNPYLISSAGELKLLAEMINSELEGEEKEKYNADNVYYVLTCDILLNDTSSWETWNDENRPGNEWVPIGFMKMTWEEIAFEANFDGGEHVVRGLYISNDEMFSNSYQGLFGIATGNISDLGIEQSYVKGENFVGGVAGSAGNVEKCYNKGTIIGVSDVGGVAGRAMDITGCYNEGTVTIDADGSVGGVAGRAKNVTDCYNKGTVTNNVAYNGTVAGVVCYSNGNVTNCYNEGMVTNNAASYGSAAGVVYYSDGNVTDCYNEGRVTNNAASYGSAAGVVCYSDGNVTNCYNTETVTNHAPGVTAGVVCESLGDITDCYNTGTIISTASYDNYCNSYGIGSSKEPYYYYFYARTSNIINCYNEGNIISEYSACGIGRANNDIINCYNTGNLNGEVGVSGIGTTKYMADCYNTGNVTGGLSTGGLIGNTNGINEMTNCYNTGNVTGNDYTGGLIGKTNGMFEVTNCYNTGNITGNDYAGGLVGQANYSIEMTNCYNTGNVTGGDYTGGLVGERVDYYSGYEIIIVNSCNTGNVTGNDYAGGLFGSIKHSNYNDSKSEIDNCYNTGNVIGQKNVGGVFGHFHFIYTGRVTNCYNTGNVIGNENVGGIGGDTFKGRVDHCYFLKTESINTDLDAINGRSEVDEHLFGFNEDGIIQGTVPGLSPDPLLKDALNRWAGAHSRWMGTPFPTLANTPILYEITYENLNGASNDNPSSYTIETSMITLNEPGERSGFVFKEWRITNGSGAEIKTIPSGSTGNITIWAVWDEIFEITYENLNGVSNDNPSSYTIGTSTITLNEPGERSGFVFKEWRITNGNGEVITSITSENIGNITLWAVWEEIFEITFENTNGASHDNPSSYTAGTSVVLATPGEIAGFVFKEWRISNGNGEVITSITSENTGNITIWAVWDEVFEITYENLNGASHDNPSTYIAGTSVPLAEPGEVAGFVFIEWRITDGSGVEIKTIPSGSTGNITLWAVWDEIYKIVYVNLKGASNDNPLSYTAGTDEITLVAPGEVAGHVFKEWRLADEDGNGEVITSITSENIGVLVLYAVWELEAQDEVYKITYVNLNGASNDNPLSYTAGTSEITLVAPGDVAGHVFKEWRLIDEDGNGEVITSITSENTGVLVLYAVWGSEAQQYAGGSLLDDNMILILFIVFAIAVLSVNTVIMRRSSKKS